MPEKETLERAREDAREGKSPSTQAGEGEVGEAVAGGGARAPARGLLGGVAAIIVEAGTAVGAQARQRRQETSRPESGSHQGTDRAQASRRKIRSHPPEARGLTLRRVSHGG